MRIVIAQENEKKKKKKKVCKSFLARCASSKVCIWNFHEEPSTGIAE